MVLVRDVKFTEEPLHWSWTGAWGNRMILSVGVGNERSMLLRAGVIPDLAFCIAINEILEKYLSRPSMSTSCFCEG
jgi:hypothetical protein